VELQSENNLDGGFRIKRLGVVMRPDPTLKEESEGVLNPGAARGPDGHLYLFPRLLSRNNYSRIGIVRVLFNGDGTPSGVERLGIALEPQEPYELRPRDATGGCEDPRVTFIETLGRYVMAYVAWGPNGPRVALAVSQDCLHWERLGLVDFQPDIEGSGVTFNTVDNKDAAFAPDPVHTPDGRLILIMLHRPRYTTTGAPGIWVSGCDLAAVKRDIRQLCVMTHHTPLAQPAQEWEADRIGVGTPPVRTRLGYMIIYHGVSGDLVGAPGKAQHVTYDAGVLMFRRDKDLLLRYRTTTPILIPEVKEETDGVVNNVVFPTGIDKRTEDILDVYYGMADKYIGVARLWLPDTLHFDEADSVRRVGPEPRR